MSSAFALPAPLVLVDLVPRSLARTTSLVVGGAALTGLCAQIAFPVPGTPVPVTLQTFSVLLVGAALGWRLAAASMGLYLAAGVAGVPWFSGQTSGWTTATSGYLVGFLVAAALVGVLSSRGGDRTPLRTAATMSLGTLTIYVFGAGVLAASLDVGLGEALRLARRGALPGRRRAQGAGCRGAAPARLAVRGPPQLTRTTRLTRPC